MDDSIKGNLSVSNNVLSDIIGNAVYECYGVVGMTVPASASEGIVRILPSSRLRKGVVVENKPEGIQVDVYVVIEYGTNIGAVCSNIKERIEFVLSSQVRVPVTSVNVHVEGMKVSR